MTSSVIVKRTDFPLGIAGSFAKFAILVDIVSQMNNIVMLVLSSRIPISIEVTIGWAGQRISNLNEPDGGGGQYSR